MIERKKFFSSIKTSLFKSITQKQVDGIECIFDAWEKSSFTDMRWLAYMLATAFHETGKTMQPVEEYGKGKARNYGKKIKHSGQPYNLPDQIYYGRGLVQLTWYENYELMSRLIGHDILNNPGDA